MTLKALISNIHCTLSANQHRERVSLMYNNDGYQSIVNLRPRGGHSQKNWVRVCGHFSETLTRQLSCDKKLETKMAKIDTLFLTKRA